MLDRRKLLPRLIAAGLVLVLAAIGIFATVRAVKQRKEAAYLESYGQTALYVGSYTVTYDLYRYFYLNYRDELATLYQNEDGETDTAALDRAVRTRVAEAVRGLYGTVALAADHAITPTDGDIRAEATEYIDAVREYYGAAEYAAELERNYMTEQVFDLLIRIDGTEDKLFTALTAAGGLIENDDAALLARMQSDSFVRVKQIFVENDPGEDPEANRAIAEAALADYRGGVDFSTLIGRYSEDFSMPTDGYYFTRGVMTAEFEAAAFALADGEVSEVIESADGFHILLRLPKEESYITAHFEELKADYQNAEFYAMLDARAAGLTVTEADYVRTLDAKEIR